MYIVITMYFNLTIVLTNVKNNTYVYIYAYNPNMEEMGKKSDNVMVRLTMEEIQEIDEIWKREKFPSRSDYIRNAVKRFKDPTVVCVEFTQTEFESVLKAVSKNRANSISDYAKEAILNYSKKELIREIVDNAICDVLRDPSRKDDLREIVRDLVNEEMREKFAR